MKIISKTILEGGSVFRAQPEVFDDVPAATGKTRVNVYNVEKQSILGFGGAFTGSSAAVYAGLDAAAKAKVMEMLFGKSGLRYNFCRICIGSSDFSPSEYCYIEDGDTSLSTFSIERDRAEIIPMIRDAMKTAKASGEEIIFFASPWSPPGFMKNTGERIQGIANHGCLLPEYYGLYANYIMRFIEEYEKEGIHISAITPQNEPLALTTWEGCLFDAKAEAEFIKYLDMASKAHGLDVRIWAFDHNKGRYYHSLEEIYPLVGDLLDGSAFHWYSGSHFDELSLVREQYPDKVMIHSEFCNGLGRAHFDDYGAEILGNLSHGVNAECEWNLLLDSEGGPFHDRTFGCSASLLADGNNLTVRQSYNEMFLFSHFIRRGAKALAVSTYHRDLMVAAFRNPDGKIIVVLRNESGFDITFKLSVLNVLIPTSILPHSMVAYEIEA